MSIRRVLVANRGEIACRVMRSLRAAGVECVALYSEADREALHRRLADRSVFIGEAPPTQSYLDIDKVIAAAKDSGCDAVHPGYGFLSENAAFARACSDAGLCFIGPSPEVIEEMGDKGRARERALALGVSPVPGYEGGGDDARLTEEAKAIGFPLLVKAAHGGGGKGMRLVRKEEELAVALQTARREALGAFGRDELILERYVHPARHVEVQVLGDGKGHAIAVYERECSLQRRHQKVVEECPSPAVDPALRKRFQDAAVRLAAGVNYGGAGTVEFLLGPDDAFYFLEMNTRLQVEHGVTEMVAGVDLVEWQLRIARGEELPAAIAPEDPRGHAIEVRLYAEDPAKGFLPQTGTLEALELPVGPGVRVDSGVCEGDEVSPHYDPMLLKVMAQGATREEARRRLVLALREMRVLGLATNLGYLVDVLEWEAFTSGETYTHVLEAWTPPEPAEGDDLLWMLAGALSGASSGTGPVSFTGGGAAGDLYSPFASDDGFRLIPSTEQQS